MMLWHALAVKMENGKVAKMKAADVPVMAILKEFREMAGPRGRQRHRAQAIPKYEYEKHRSAVKLE